MISAVLFDAFGTIFRIRRRTNPYLQLMREGRQQGLSITPESTHFAMTANLPFAGIADHLGIALSASKRMALSEALEKELSSIEPYPASTTPTGPATPPPVSPPSITEPVLPEGRHDA